MRSSGPPTGPRAPVSALCIKNSTGSFSRSDVLMRPLVSAGFDGTTTLIPGISANQDSMTLLCCAPPYAMPLVARITSGTAMPNM
jgi:hypothetical protein